MMGESKKMRGFIALTTVLIILGIVLAVGLGLGLLSIGEAQMSLQKSQSSQVYYLANLCAERALMELKETKGAYGGENIDIEGGNCQILVEGIWTIKVTATFSGQTKKMKIIVSQIDPEMIIGSWQEVAEF